MADPVLSICVPSRNRQIYFQETIRSLLVSERDDVQFVFADNSDDPSVMDGFMEPHRGDPRIVYLKSTDRILPMLENWERAARITTGRYVTFIGDDDYVDPNLAAFLKRIDAIGGADAVAWSGYNYIWPLPEDTGPRWLELSLDGEARFFNKHDLMRRTFTWENAHVAPNAGFSIYHGAISRKLLRKIQEKAGGRTFEFPIVDWEITYKSILLGETFLHSSRSFSTPGACPLSNSHTTGSLQAEKKGQDIFFRELGRDINEDDWIKATPLRTWHGLTACIFLTQLWVAQRYRVPLPKGYEPNLVRALANNMASYRTREDFEFASDRVRSALRAWQDGTHLPLFNPVFPEPTGIEPATLPIRFSGIDQKGRLHFPDDIAGAPGPGRLFQVIEKMLERPETIRLPAMEAAA